MTQSEFDPGSGGSGTSDYDGVLCIKGDSKSNPGSYKFRAESVEFLNQTWDGPGSDSIDRSSDPTVVTGAVWSATDEFRVKGLESISLDGSASLCSSGASKEELKNAGVTVKSESSTKQSPDSSVIGDSLPEWLSILPSIGPLSSEMVTVVVAILAGAIGLKLLTGEDS